MTKQLLCCPCCGGETLAESGAWEICPVCHWEDDPLQAENPDLAGGANAQSLNDAKKAYRRQFPT